MFCSDIIIHGIFIIHSSSKQLVTRKGFCIPECINLYFLHSIFLLLKFTNHETILCRHHYYAVIWIFYNKHIKLNSPPISLEVFMITYLFILQLALIPYLYISSGQYLFFFANSLYETPQTRLDRKSVS